MMQKAMEVTGIHGTYTMTCNDVMEVVTTCFVFIKLGLHLVLEKWCVKRDEMLPLCKIKNIGIYEAVLKI